MDLRWQMAMLTMRARRKGHFSRECRSSKDPRRPEDDKEFEAKEVAEDAKVDESVDIQGRKAESQAEI
nr:hypothetical protein [Tanacetum cinerariifolium]